MTRLIPQDLFMFFQFYNFMARLIPQDLFMFFQFYNFMARLIPQDLFMFLNLNALKLLKHPNIITLYDYDKKVYEKKSCKENRLVNFIAIDLPAEAAAASAAEQLSHHTESPAAWLPTAELYDEEPMR